MTTSQLAHQAVSNARRARIASVPAIRAGMHGGTREREPGSWMPQVARQIETPVRYSGLDYGYDS